MELELKKEQFACYQALPQLSENREETTTRRSRGAR